MARILSYEGKIPKRIGDFVIYKLGDDLIVRSISGFTTEELKKSAKYVNCRKSSTEFGLVSSTCKLIRMELQELLPKSNNLAVVNSFTKKMLSLLTFDTINTKGSRNLATALANEDGIKSLLNYNFNPDCEWIFAYEMEMQHVSLKVITLPLEDQPYWIGYRTHIFDFQYGAGANNLVSSTWHFESAVTPELVLPLPPLETSKGTRFYLLEVSLFLKVDLSFEPATTATKALIIIHLA